MEKSPEAFRTISEVGGYLDVPQHVLRFWETKFTQIKPMKRAGGRRYYRPTDVDLLRGIRHLLYDEGYTIRGVQKLLREHGAGFAIEAGQTGAVPAISAPESVEVAEQAPGNDGGSPDAAPIAQLAGGLGDDERVLLTRAFKDLEHARELIAGTKSVKPF